MTTRRPFPTPARLAFALLALGLVSACRAPKREPDPIDPRSIPVFSGDASGVAPWDSVVQTCADAAVVLVGEVHGHPLGLRIAADLFEAVLAKNPRAVLSMEFYERDRQVDLDDYLAGITSPEEFDKAAFRNDSNNPPGHRRMVEAARLAGRPIIASNAPRRYARLARTEGYDRLRSLTAEQRRLFEIPDARDPDAYSERFRAAMGNNAGHGGSESMSPDAFLRAQLLWDATMADSVADATALGQPVIHVVGRFHAEYGTEPGKSALTDAIAQRLQPEQRIVIITVLDEDAGGLRVEDVGRGHFVVYVGSLAPPEQD